MAKRNILPTQRCVKCGHVTTERKPLCARHLDKSPYVQDLKRRLVAYEKLCVATKITPGSLVAHEILYALIECGCISYRVLRRNSRISYGLFDLYISHFVREGLCVVKTSKKGRNVKMIYTTALTLGMYGC